MMNSVLVDQDFPTAQQSIETNSIPSIRISTSSNINQMESKYAHMNDLVNLLYQEPYSMTSEVFQKFNETQMTYNCSQPEETLKLTIETLTQQPETHSLYCHETIVPPSPMPFSPHCVMPEILDFDSDDSVKDKDYQPCDEVFSDDTDCEYGNDMLQNTVSNPKSNPKLKRKSPINKTFTKRLITRRHTHEFTRTEETIGHRLPKKRRTSLSIIDCSFSTDLVNLAPPSSTKRKKYDRNLKDRLVEKKKELRSKYNVKTGCNTKCTKCCSTIFTPEERLDINNKYWMMTHSERRLFIRSNYTVSVPKRKYVQEPKRNAKRGFTLQKSDGVLMKNSFKIYSKRLKTIIHLTKKARNNHFINNARNKSKATWQIINNK